MATATAGAACEDVVAGSAAEATTGATDGVDPRVDQQGGHRLAARARATVTTEHASVAPRRPAVDARDHVRGAVLCSPTWVQPPGAVKSSARWP